jgi:hypothetical protein
MAAAAPEIWRENWEKAFTSDAPNGLVKAEHVIYNRTFVCVQMLNREMFNVWFDLLKANNYNTLTTDQRRPILPGPCKLYMCFLTSNHMNVRDPESISCIVPTYVHGGYICFQGLMELRKSFTGSVLPYEQLTLLLIASKFIPRDASFPFDLIFMSLTQEEGKILRSLLEAKDINFNHCVGGTLHSASINHPKKKCTCKMEVSDWKSIGIVSTSEGIIFSLPRITFNGESIGTINVPWVTGRSFDILKQKWVVSDANIAALTEPWLKKTDDKELIDSQKVSFLSILVGIDGILIVDFRKFITLDPAELKPVPKPSAQGSA